MACSGPAALAVDPVPTDPQAHVEAAEAALERDDYAVAAAELVRAAEQSDEVALAGRATQFAVGTGYDAWAERAAQRWTALSPQDPRPRELLGRIYLRRHDVDGAVAEWTAALSATDPLRDDVYLRLAEVLAAGESPRLVTRALARLTALDPLSPGLQFALAGAAHRSGQVDLALAALDVAEIGSPDWIEPRLLRAQVIAGLGRLDEALALLDALAVEAAAADEALPVALLRARLLLAGGRADEADAVLDALAPDDGDDPLPDLSRTRAMVALARGRIGEAVASLRDLAGQAAHQGEALYYLGELAASRGEDEAALRFWRRVAPGPWLLPARLAVADRLPAEEAIDELAALARAQPAEAWRIQPYRARLLQRLQQPAQALAALDEAVLQRPDAIETRLARGMLLEESGRIDEALADLAHAAAIAPDDAIAINAYGYTLLNRKRRAREAWPLIRRALALEPDSAPIQDSMGWVLFHLGEPALARSYLEVAWAALPDAEIASHLAEVYWRLGDRASARDLLHAALLAQPDSRPARDTARRLLRR